MSEHHDAAKRTVLEKLSADGRKLFEFVKTHERRKDWHVLQRGSGKPSPKLRVVDKVRELIPESSEASNGAR